MTGDIYAYGLSTKYLTRVFYVSARAPERCLRGSPSRTTQFLAEHLASRTLCVYVSRLFLCSLHL
ncbi:hypothetical protein J6590_033622 [Homalodisca vitripennis]|nr:hypothetical protein J6590_033622 [Homalodisca vitripennis]